MRTARTIDGRPIVASPNAPKEAICPCCAGTLTLRSRRTMNNGQATYYWRHQGNKNPLCSARKRPVN